MPDRIVTEEELKRDAKHLDYEIWMLMECAERLQGSPQVPVDEVLRRALLEACLIHLRLLVEFFRTSKGYPDDLRAVDYFEQSANKSNIEALAPAENSWEDKRAREIHKALAHIVQDRNKLNTDWSEWDLQLAIPRLRAFFRLLPPERRVWFPRASHWFAGSVVEPPIGSA